MGDYNVSAQQYVIKPQYNKWSGVWSGGSVHYCSLLPGDHHSGPGYEFLNRN